ncbi:MAG: type 4a pilus biogenesis protein PilO [Desulfotomaculales bacterium]
MWNRLSNREKILLSIAAFAAFAYAAYHFLLGPQIKAYQDKAAQLKEVRAMLENLDSQAGALKLETAALEQTRARLKKLLDKFSTQMQDGLFLVQFGRLAEKNGVQIRKFKPSEPVDFGYILVLPVEIELRGTHPSIISVINYLENVANLTEIRNLKFQADIQQTTKSDRQGAVTVGSAVYETQAAPLPETITASMLLLIYTQPSPEGRTQMEEIKKLSAGRSNPFIPPARQGF